MTFDPTLTDTLSELASRARDARVRAQATARREHAGEPDVHDRVDLPDVCLAAAIHSGDPAEIRAASLQTHRGRLPQSLPAPDGRRIPLIDTLRPWSDTAGRAAHGPFDDSSGRLPLVQWHVDMLRTWQALHTALPALHGLLGTALDGILLLDEQQASSSAPRTPLEGLAYIMIDRDFGLAFCLDTLVFEAAGNLFDTVSGHAAGYGGYEATRRHVRRNFARALSVAALDAVLRRDLVDTWERPLASARIGLHVQRWRRGASVDAKGDTLAGNIAAASADYLERFSAIYRCAVRAIDLRGQPQRFCSRTYLGTSGAIELPQDEVSPIPASVIPANAILPIGSARDPM